MLAILVTRIELDSMCSHVARNFRSVEGLKIYIAIRRAKA